MKNCEYDDQIDDYLLNKLEGEPRDDFEEHYFNCPSCFRKMEERDPLISTIKSRGAWSFKEPASRQREWVPAWTRALSSFPPRQWATVGVAAAALLVVVFGVLPQLRDSSPQFVLSETEVARGQALTLMSPIIDVRSVPTFFEWKPLSQEAEYKISLYNGGQLWSAVTKDSRIAIPEETRQLQQPGQRFAWQGEDFCSRRKLIVV